MSAPANDQRRAGRLDGLREAARLLRDMEAEVARRLEHPAALRTRDARRVRRKAFQVGARRIETVARAAERASRCKSSVPAALRALGITVDEIRTEQAQ